MKMRICYFGLYDQDFSRNRIYIRGLRENGIEVIECQDRSKGFWKYVRLYKKHKALKDSYDVMIVGYPGYIIVPFARLISRKPVVFDALCSFYEAQILSRNAYRGAPFRVTYTRVIDWLANTFAQLILLETEAQKEYYVKTLGVPENKCAVIYTGVDDETFFYDPKVAKHEKFTVLFRGRLMSEAGVKYIVEAARILKDKDIYFEIIGFGWGRVMTEVSAQVKSLALPNLNFIPKSLPFEELRMRMLQCHVSLGQFELHDRIQRTIPHKAFESMAMKLPYITADAKAVKEIIKDGHTGMFVPVASAEKLAEKILWAKENPDALQALAQNSYDFYFKTLTPKLLASNILQAVKGRFFP